MATRLYFESSGSFIIAPTAWPTGWTTIASVAAKPLTDEKRSSTSANQNRALNGSSGTLTPSVAFVSRPLSAQTISGTIKGQFRVLESNAGDNATLAVGVTIMKPDGTVRATLLSPTASDDTSATPPEMATSATNRKFLDSSESASITLTSGDASEGDMLVVTVGARQASTNTNTFQIFAGSDSGTDLAEDDTTTTANNPWIEFSGTISFQTLFYYGSAATPEDAASEISEPVTSAVTPPTGMVATRDLVIMVGQLQVADATAVTLSEQGGQSWTEIGTRAANDQGIKAWWCIFDGTWDANPSVAFSAQSGTQPASVQMHVFRAPVGYTWASDQASTGSDFTAPTTPFTVTLSPANTAHNIAVVLAGWFTGDDNSWTALAGAGWELCGTAQYRNTAGSDQSATYAYIYKATAGDPGDVSKNQTTVTGDAGTALIAYFYAASANTSIEVPSANLTLSTFAPSAVIPIAIEIPSANLALSTFAPGVLLATNIEVPSANLALSTFAPDVAQTANTAIEVPSANLALSTFAPGVAQTTNVVASPPAADLSLSTFAPDVSQTFGIQRDVPSADLALSTFAPSLDLGISPPSANLSLSTFAPVVVLSDHITLSPVSANLTLSTFAPSLVLELSPASADLSLSTFAPTLAVSDHRSIEVPAANLALSTFAPTVAVTDNRSLEIPSANLALSTFAPGVSLSEHRSLEIPSANLTLTTSAPGIAATDHRSLEIPSANLSLTTESPSVTTGDSVSIQVPSADLTLSTFVPTVQADASVSIEIPAANLSLSTFAVSVSVTAHIAIEIPSANLTLTSSAPTLTEAFIVSPATVDLSLQGFAPDVAVTANHFAEPASANLSLSTVAPTSDLSGQLNIEVPTAVLTLVASAPVVGFRPARVSTKGRPGGVQAAGTIRSNIARGTRSNIQNPLIRRPVNGA